MLYQRSSWITNALNSDCTHYVLMLSHVRQGFRTVGPSRRCPSWTSSWRSTAPSSPRLPCRRH
ncbi:hypothetical protein L210DRAFT_3550199 [Boletus edulis BED1]|uniref:Uncharacterized protein n=1 Tax=Boletus edulis BED1 TaxID=1328754 RepID=A0AAD4GBN7_BOLED|nr:hypothetical protein L210DRAFT_3550199 [Boletus edulis BED1]